MQLNLQKAELGFVSTDSVCCIYTTIGFGVYYRTIMFCAYIQVFHVFNEQLGLKYQCIQVFAAFARQMVVFVYVQRFAVFAETKG